MLKYQIQKHSRKNDGKKHDAIQYPDRMIRNIHHRANELNAIGNKRLTTGKKNLFAIRVIHPVHAPIRGVVFYMIYSAIVRLNTIAGRTKIDVIGMLKQFTEKEKKATQR